MNRHAVSAIGWHGCPINYPTHASSRRTGGFPTNSRPALRPAQRPAFHSTPAHHVNAPPLPPFHFSLSPHPPLTPIRPRSSGVILTQQLPCLSSSRYRPSSLRSSSCLSLSSTSPLPYSTTSSLSACPRHCGSSATPGSPVSGPSWAHVPMPVPHTSLPRCSPAPPGESSISAPAAGSRSNSSIRRR